MLRVETGLEGMRFAAMIKSDHGACAVLLTSLAQFLSQKKHMDELSNTTGVSCPHDAQLVAPGCCENVPVGHHVQGCFPLLENVPCGQDASYSKEEMHIFSRIL